MLQQMLNMLPRNRRYVPALPAFLPAQGQRRAKVALFLGCAGDALYRDLNWLTAKVLQINGCDVIIPQQQTCCGAIAAHSGMLPQALGQAEKNLRTFGELHDIDAIVTNISGCGAQLKEYNHLYDYADGSRQLVIPPLPLGEGRGEGTTQQAPSPDPVEGWSPDQATLPDPRVHFSSKVKDITEFLIELGPREMSHQIPVRIAYHPACHLQHAQKIKTAPVKLLTMIPGLTLLPFNEADICCGAAGSYNLTEIEMAHKLGKRKLDNLSTTEIEGVVTGNIGCMMQMEFHAREQQKSLWVKHTIELLAAGYGLIKF
jgi:glycolate oxidase iron-sulfur subunit